MTQNPPSQYSADIAPLSPNLGYATVVIAVQCPVSVLAAQEISFTIYVDPSSAVRTLTGTPIAGATMTLYYYDDVTETFTAVPNGDSMLITHSSSASNTSSPARSKTSGPRRRPCSAC